MARSAVTERASAGGNMPKLGYRGERGSHVTPGKFGRRAPGQFIRHLPTAPRKEALRIPSLLCQTLLHYTLSPVTCQYGWCGLETQEELSLGFLFMAWSRHQRHSIPTVPIRVTGPTLRVPVARSRWSIIPGTAPSSSVSCGARGTRRVNV